VLNSSRVTNESSPDSTIRLKVPVSVSYNADIDEVEDALLAVAEEEPSVLEHPKPRARFREFGDNGLQYELFAWIPNPIEKVRARHKINQSVFKEFDRRGIEIPYPQRTVHMADRKDISDNQNLSEGPN
jgi:small-conductance mechanosensitive channel